MYVSTASWYQWCYTCFVVGGPLYLHFYSPSALLIVVGEWLRDQNTMEDTITILQKEGWMA